MENHELEESLDEDEDKVQHQKSTWPQENPEKESKSPTVRAQLESSSAVGENIAPECFHHGSEKEAMALYKTKNETFPGKPIDHALPDENPPSGIFFVDNAGEGRSESTVTDTGMKASPQPQKSSVLDVMRCSDSGKCFQVEDTLDVVDGIRPTTSKTRGLALLPAIEESIDEDVWPGDPPSSSSASSITSSPSFSSSGNVLHLHTSVHKVSSKPTLTSISEELVCKTERDSLAKELVDNCTEKIVKTSNQSSSAVNVMPHPVGLCLNQGHGDSGTTNVDPKTLDPLGDTELGIGNIVTTLGACVKAAGEAVIVEEDKDKAAVIRSFECDNVRPTNTKKTEEEIKLTQHPEQSDKLLLPENEPSGEYFVFKHGQEQGLPEASAAKSTLHPSADHSYPTEREEGGRDLSQADSDIVFLTNNQRDFDQWVPMFCVGEEQVVAMSELIKELEPAARSTDLVSDEVSLKCSSEQYGNIPSTEKQVEKSGEASHDSLPRGKCPENANADTVGQEEKEGVTSLNSQRISEGERSENLMVYLGEEQVIPLSEFMKELSTDLASESSRLKHPYEETISRLRCSSSVQQIEDHDHCNISEPLLSAGSERFRPKSSGSDSLLAEGCSASGISEARESFSEHTRSTGSNERQEKDSKDKDACKQRDKEALKCRDRDKANKHTEREDTVGTHGDGGTNLRSVIENVMHAQTEGTAVLSELLGTYAKAPCRLESQTIALSENEVAWSQRQEHTQRRMMSPISSHPGREDDAAVRKRLALAGESVKVSSSHRLGKRTSHLRGSKWKTGQTTCVNTETDPNNLCRDFQDFPVREKSDTTTKDSNTTDNESSLSTQPDSQHESDSHQLYTQSDLKNEDTSLNISMTCTSSLFHSINSESWANHPISVHDESSNHPDSQAMGGSSSLSADPLSPSSGRDDSHPTEHSPRERLEKLSNQDENLPAASASSPQAVLIPNKVENAAFVSSSSEDEHSDAVLHFDKDDDAFHIPSSGRKENVSGSPEVTQDNHVERLSTREDVIRPVPSCATDKNGPNDSPCLQSEVLLNISRETGGSDSASYEVSQKEDLVKSKNSPVSESELKELKTQVDKDLESNEAILSVLNGLESALEQDQDDDIFGVNNLKLINRIEPEEGISNENGKFAVGPSQEDKIEGLQARADISDFSFSVVDSENALRHAPETEPPNAEVYESGSLLDVAANVMLDSGHFSGTEVDIHTTSSSSESADRNTTMSMSTDLDTYTSTFPLMETETDEISEDYKSSEITSKSERSSDEEMIMPENTDTAFSRRALKRMGRPGNISDDLRSPDSKQALICAGSHQSTAMSNPGRMTDRYPGAQVTGGRNISASLSPREAGIPSLFSQFGGLTVGQRQDNSYVRNKLKTSPRIDARASQERAPGASESGCGEWMVDSAKTKDNTEFSIYEEAKLLHLKSGIHSLDPELGGSGIVPRVDVEEAEVNLEKSLLEMHDQELLMHSDAQDVDINDTSAKPIQQTTTECQCLQAITADSPLEICSAVQNKCEPNVGSASQSLNTDNARLSRKDVYVFGAEQQIHEQQMGQETMRKVWKEEEYEVFEDSVAPQQIKTEARAPEINNGMHDMVQAKLENSGLTVHEKCPDSRKSQEPLAGSETKMLETAEHCQRTAHEIWTEEAMGTKTITPQTHVEFVSKGEHLQDELLTQESCLPMAHTTTKHQSLGAESPSLKNDGASLLSKVVASSDRPRSSGSFTVEDQEEAATTASIRQYPLRSSQKSPIYLGTVRRIQIVDVLKYPPDKPSIYHQASSETAVASSFHDAFGEEEEEEEGPPMRKRSLWKRVKGHLRPFKFGFSQGRWTLRRKPALPGGTVRGVPEGQLVLPTDRVKLKSEANFQSVDVEMLRKRKSQGEELQREKETIPSPSANRARPTLLPSQPLEETGTTSAQPVTAWHRPHEAEQHVRLRSKASMQRDQWRRFRRLRTLRHSAEERGSLPAMRKHHVTKKNYVRDLRRNESMEESGRRSVKDSRKTKSKCRHRRRDASLELLSDNVITCRASNSSHDAAPEVFEIFCDDDPKESKHDSLRKEEATVRFLMASTAKSNSAYGTAHSDVRAQNSTSKTESSYSGDNIVPVITSSKRKLCSLM